MSCPHYRSVFEEPASHAANSAVRAVKNWKRWGYTAAFKYMFNNGVSPLMFAVVTEFELSRKSASTKDR